MKYFLTLAVLTIHFTSFSQKIGINDVLGAIKTGNASLMAKYFDNSVEISLPEKSSSFSKSQAELVLKDFFGNYPVKNFEIIHKGENAGSEYCIGTLVTKNGSFRTTIFMKQKVDGQVLQELRFENR
jgi:hypothetical protein